MCLLAWQVHCTVILFGSSSSEIRRWINIAHFVCNCLINISETGVFITTKHWNPYCVEESNGDRRLAIMNFVIFCCERIKKRTKKICEGYS